MTQKRTPSPRSCRIGIALAIVGVAAFGFGCKQSESQRWAQTAPTIAPAGVNLPVFMGVHNDDAESAVDSDFEPTG